jgi:hypothetical protein
MPVEQYNLFGKKVSQTYHNLVQSGSDGKFYDGDGNEITINATIPDIYATTGSNIFIGDQTITGSIYMDAPGTDSIYFSGSGPAGRFVWNEEFGTMELTLQRGNVSVLLGQKQVVKVVNKTGGNVLRSNYQAVRVSGAQGQRLAIQLAQADNDANSATTIGLIAENIDNNQEGFITTGGQIIQVDTTGDLQGETWSDGDILYLSPTTPGRLTNIKPLAPQHTVIIGFVEHKNKNNGRIFVKVDNGYEIDELHNVLINTGSLATGDLLVRSGSNGGVWINSKQLSGSYGLTGSLTISSSNALNVSGSIFVSSGSFPFQTSRYIVGWDSQSNQLVTYLTTSIAGGGGGGTPGGSTNQFQYNNGGTFGGASSLNYNPITTYTLLTGSVLIPTGAALTHTFNSSSLTEFRSDQFSYITSIIIPTSRTGSIFDLTSLGYNKSNYNSMYFEYSLITTGSSNLIKRGEIKCVYDSNSYDFVDQYMEISGSAVRDMTFDISQSSTNIFLNYTASAGLRSLTTTYLLKGIIKLL